MIRALLASTAGILAAGTAAATSPTRKRPRFGRFRRLSIGAVSAAAVVTLAACSVGAGAALSGSDASTTTTTTAQSASTSSALATIDTHYDEDDLTWSEDEVSTVSLSDDGSTSDSDAVTVDGSTVTITAGGVYRDRKSVV